MSVKMISSAQFSRLAAACAALLIAGALAGPASAQGTTCKDDVVTISGRAKFRPFTKTKELEGRGAAMADAVANWEREVGTRFGAQWRTWSKATGTSFTCAPTKTGKIIGTSFIGCTISGRPCAATSPLGGAVVEDEEGKRIRDKRERVDEPDDDDKASRADERGRYRAARRKAEWSRPYRQRTYRDCLASPACRAESPAYRREMARQDYLAAARRSAERSAYRREMARQDYLAAARRRAEAAAFRRGYVRHGDLAYRRHWYERRPMWAY